ncbi:MAG: hypothetical protein ACD_17C00258G0004 [uncultured bacterium]|nr:MAG: hypothetical protein ACD_17C00258G0004 [uncultured bacterium]
MIGAFTCQVTEERVQKPVAVKQRAPTTRWLGLVSAAITAEAAAPPASPILMSLLRHFALLPAFASPNGGMSSLRRATDPVSINPIK